MDNVVFANGFEEYIEGIKSVPQKKQAGIQRKRYDMMILSWLFFTSLLKKGYFVFLSFKGRIVFCAIFSSLYVFRVSFFPSFIDFVIDVVDGY